MAKGASNFKFKPGDIERFGKKMANNMVAYDKLMERNMVIATNMIWTIAHQRRPYITKAEMKATGRRRRVSDPGAERGVPVQTGNLQSSITKDVRSIGYGRYRGIIDVDQIKAPYAHIIEYGNSRIAKRPFMRPAVNLTREPIKALFNLKVISKL